MDNYPDATSCGEEIFSQLCCCFWRSLLSSDDWGGKTAGKLVVHLITWDIIFPLAFPTTLLGWRAFKLSNHHYAWWAEFLYLLDTLQYFSSNLLPLGNFYLAEKRALVPWTNVGDIFNVHSGLSRSVEWLVGWCRCLCHPRHSFQFTTQVNLLPLEAKYSLLDQISSIIIRGMAGAQYHETRKISPQRNQPGFSPTTPLHLAKQQCWFKALLKP